MVSFRCIGLTAGALTVSIALAFSCGGDDGDVEGSGDGTGGAAPADGGGVAASTSTGGSAWDPTGDGGPVNVGDGGVEVTDDHGTFICYPTTCAGKLLQCGDCVDNDGDGLIDWRDRECLGPCDNTEGPGLDPNVGGGGANVCTVDCFFDYGNGPGNDQCIWSHNCDPLEPEPLICPYMESMLGGNKCPDQQVELCAEVCLPFTPNGCDCFGCCTFPELATAGPNGGPGYVYIGTLDESNSNASTCTFEDVTNPEKCAPCTPVANCLNGCGLCELCLGKTELPPECFNDAGEPVDRCPPGDQPCGLPDDEPCLSSYYCISGCCVATVR
jgi:hypothetical protein